VYRYPAISETRLKIANKATNFVLNVVYYNPLAIDQMWRRIRYPIILQTLAFMEFLSVKLSETLCLAPTSIGLSYFCFEVIILHFIFDRCRIICRSIKIVKYKIGCVDRVITFETLNPFNYLWIQTRILVETILPKNWKIVCSCKCFGEVRIDFKITFHEFLENYREIRKLKK